MNETPAAAEPEIDVRQVDRIVQGFWDQDVRAWSSHWAPIFRKFARDLVTDARLSRGEIVLDIGTGTGLAALEAARHVKPGGLVLALDRSRPMLKFAELSAKRDRVRNVVFFEMNADRMLFPDELFDVVLSNCGIAYTTFPAAVAEAFRVLRKGGTFVLNDWHLKDVQAHRVFGGILQQHRTNHPSKRLRAERTAMATFERKGSRYSDLNELVIELQRAGFAETQTKYRTYRIKLRGVQEFLAMRLEREALKHELRELTQAKRRMMLDELRRGLKPFLRKGRFIFDWKVAYVSARKPN